jgi:hypothetical protein
MESKSASSSFQPLFQWRGWLFWTCVVLVVIGVVVRSTLYAIYGADTGVAIIDANGDLAFVNVDAVTGSALIKTIQSHGVSILSDNSLTSEQLLMSTMGKDINSDDIIIPYYLDMNHPCNSFYDSICGIYDSDGTENMKEDVAQLQSNGLTKKRSSMSSVKKQLKQQSKARSSGTFYDVSESSKAITAAVIKNLSTYKHCEAFLTSMVESDTQSKTLILEALKWENLPVPQQQSTVSVSLLFQNGLELPIIMEVKKLFHLADFGIHMRLNPLPIVDLSIFPEHLPERERGLIVAFYQQMIERDNEIMNDINSVQEYIDLCFTRESIASARFATSYGLTVGMVKDFLFLIDTILPNSQISIPYMCFSKAFIPGLDEFNMLVNQSPVIFWSYFHKLTLSYNILQYLDQRDSLNSVQSYSNIPNSGISYLRKTNFNIGVTHLDIKQEEEKENKKKTPSLLSISKLELTRLLYNNNIQRLDRQQQQQGSTDHDSWQLKKISVLNINTDEEAKNVDVQDLVLKKICQFHPNQEEDTEEEEENQHSFIFGSSYSFFLVNISNNQLQLHQVLPSNLEFKKQSITVSGIIHQVCIALVNVIDQDRVNRYYANATEVNLGSREHYEKDSTRSKDVFVLVERILNNTKELITRSTFSDIRTKEGLTNKLNNVVIRVMKPVQDSLYSTFTSNGFKTIEDSPCEAADLIFSQNILNPLCLGYSRSTNLQNNSGISSLDVIFQQSYNMFSNRFNLHKHKAIAPYQEYRTNYTEYVWDDLIADVPFPIVNAWYDPLMNTITIPIGISLFPMFRNVDDLDDAILGVVIGHELGHSLDHSGRFFDQFGNYVYNNTIDTEDDDGLWFPTDLVIISERMECLAKQYGHPCGNENYGYQTMGEDIADQVGVLSGMMALLKNKQDFLNQQYNSISGITPISNTTILREYFTNYARLWCGRSTSSDQCNQVETDPHALSKHRVNKTLKQIKAFLEAFQCHPNSHMAENEQNTCIIYQQ